jgi:anthranilate synthase component I
MPKSPKINLPKIDLPLKPFYKKISQDIDFFELFKLVEKKFENCFLMESLGEEGSERNFVLGFDPQMLFWAKQKELFWQIKNQEIQSLSNINPYYKLREILPQNILSRNYAGGLVGFLNYEAINYFEESLNLPESQDFENFKFGLYLDGLVLDKMTGEIFYFYYKNDKSDLIQEFLQELKKNTPSKRSKSIISEFSTFERGLRSVSSPLGGSGGGSANTSVKFLGNSLSQPEFEKMVKNTIEEIKKGNSFQAEVGFRSNFEIKGSKINIYEKLRKINPSPFMFYNKFENQVILGASPELLFRLKEGFMQSSPLAGTILRGKNDKEDTKLARELLNDPKEIAEHNMLVDMHRNDIGRVAKFGTVRIAKLMEVKKFALVQHISSDITGIIKDEEDMFSSLASNFPMGTLSGAPKIESMKIIAKNEKVARGPYGGGFGIFGLNGDCNFCGILRSLYIKGEKAYSQTSAGIVFDSKPDKEYQEVENKLLGMKWVLDGFAE